MTRREAALREVTSVDARLRGREADLPEVLRGAGGHVEESVPGARRQLLLLLFVGEVRVVLSRRREGGCAFLGFFFFEQII